MFKMLTSASLTKNCCKWPNHPSLEICSKHIHIMEYYPVTKIWCCIQLVRPLGLGLGPSFYTWSFYSQGMLSFLIRWGQFSYPQGPSTYHICVWITFADVPLAKASHMAKLSITALGLHKGVDTEGHDSLGTTTLTIYHKISIQFIHQIFTGHLLFVRCFTRCLGTVVSKTDVIPVLIFTVGRKRDSEQAMTNVLRVTKKSRLLWKLMPGENQSKESGKVSLRNNV